MLVYFGYSYCPDICPAALSSISKALLELGKKKVIHAVFITLDPKRDTPENLQSYAQNFHSDLIMLTGGQSQIDQAIKVYKVHAAHVPADQGSTHKIDHSSLIYLMDKDGKYVTHFDHRSPAEDIVERVKLHLQSQT